MTKSIIKVAAIALAVILTACGGKQQPSKEIIVSIEPLRYLVEQITQGDVEAGVLVPAGASPETFDPTPRQMAEVEDAKLLLTTGLIDFEKNLLELHFLLISIDRDICKRRNLACSTDSASLLISKRLDNSTCPCV